jgi:hypothetical protein
MNADQTQDMNYFSKFLVLKDVLMTLQFFVKLNFPQWNKSHYECNLTVAILNFRTILLAELYNIFSNKQRTISNSSYISNTRISKTNEN